MDLFTAGSPVVLPVTPSVISGLKFVVRRDEADERQCLPVRAGPPSAKTLANRAFAPAFEARLPPRF
jgi:hypothetical protein